MIHFWWYMKLSQFEIWILKSNYIRSLGLIWIFKRFNLTRMSILQSPSTHFLSNFWPIQVQINLCQKLLFLHQLTHNMTSDCSLNYKFNTYMKIPSSNLRRTCVQKGYPTEIVTDIQNNFCTQHVLTVFCKMRRASNKYLPVKTVLVKSIDTVNERRISKCWQKVCLLFLTFFKRLLEFFLSALFALEFGIE